MSNCVLMKRHFFCNYCNSYFRRLDGDLITFQQLKLHCPYCGSKSVTELSEENEFLECLSSLRYKIKRIICRQ